MTEFLSFFLILLAGLFFSALFNKLHLPWVIALIVSGIAIGPFGFGIFEPNATIEFLGEVGLVFLMFMAGLETRFSSLAHYKKGVSVLAVANGLIPFFIGAAIGLFFGFELLPSFLIGVIFISSSIAVVVPSLESNRLFSTKLGKLIVGSTMIEDIVSLILLSVVLQLINPVTRIPLPLFYGLLLVFVVFLRWVIPKIRWLISFSRRHEVDLFQQELRLIFTILIGVVVVFELLGLHTIIAGFFAGLTLSESIRSRVLEEKLRAISYGIFIPVFFVLVGSKTDMSVFLDTSALLVTVLLIGGLIFGKFASGWLAGQAIGFSKVESSLIGFASMPQLSTSLAAAFTAQEIGLLSQELVTGIIILSVVTTFLAPIAINRISRILPKREEANFQTL